MCPLAVAGAKSERYFWTARAVNLGHVENKLFLTAFMSICLGGLNAAWWRYLMSASLNAMVYSFYAMCLVWTVCVSGDVLVFYFSGNIHNLVSGSHPPFHTRFLL